MAELEIKATITSIAKYEKASGKSLMTAFDESNVGVSTIVDLVQALSGVDDETIDAYVAEHGIESLTNKLMESFKAAGFLAKETAPKAK